MPQLACRNAKHIIIIAGSVALECNPLKCNSGLTCRIESLVPGPVNLWVPLGAVATVAEVYGGLCIVAPVNQGDDNLFFVNNFNCAEVGFFR